MKIIPNVTIQAADKDGQRIYHPAGTSVDLPKPAAEELVERGFATVPGQASEAPATGLGISTAGGPQVIGG